MAESIMQNDRLRCLICLREGNLEEHHVMFGTANRKLSEKYGLKVYLCPECHRTGKNSVHSDARQATKLKAYAQSCFQLKYTDLDFAKIFGKNYL